MGAEQVNANIANIYLRRRAALYALSLLYAGLAITYFRQQQPSGPGIQGAYWKNETSVAADSMFTEPFIDKDEIGWFMAHAVEYGPPLELANNGRNQAIRPIIQGIAGRFFERAKELFVD